MGGKYYLKASEKNIRRDYLLDAVGNGKEGDFVSIALGGDKRFRQAHIVKNFGKFDLNKATASLVLDKYDISYVFNEKIAKELAGCPHFHRQGRLDMTNVPLVTIDGEDAKDFDDAVWAEKTVIGFNLIVAIADVSIFMSDRAASLTGKRTGGETPFICRIWSFRCCPGAICATVCAR